MPQICRKMWMIICFLVMLIKFHSVNLQKCMFQPCLSWNILGCRKGLFQCLKMQDSCALPEWWKRSGPWTEHAEQMLLSLLSCGLGTLWDGPDGLTKQRTLGWPDLGWRLQRMRLTSTLHHRKVQTKGGQEPGPASKAMQSYPKPVCQDHSGRGHTMGANPLPFEHLNVPKSKGSREGEESKRRNKNWVMCSLSCSEHPL